MGNEMLPLDSSSSSSFAVVAQFQDNDPDSAFADAPQDTDDKEDRFCAPDAQLHDAEKPAAGPLPDHIRRKILELGLSDDGYNYLQHLRLKEVAERQIVHFQKVPSGLEVVDPKVARLLDVDDSDVEELEDDFVVKANLLEEEEEEDKDVEEEVTDDEKEDGEVTKVKEEI